MANATKISVQGAKKSVELPEELFGQTTNVPLIHQVVTAQLAAARQGTHKTKNRGEVSGSGVKPFKQKGTGRSRQGSVRAPEHRGGGIVHGPTPRSYAQRTPKKMIKQAVSGLLSDRARAGRIHVTAGLPQDKPSTKAAREHLETFANTGRVLVVLDREQHTAALSLRNLPGIHVIYFDQLNAYDIVVCDHLVFTTEAFQALVAEKKNVKETVSEEASK